jgi:hypothetical protein
VDEQGHVYMIGFSNPWPSSPVLRDPDGGTDSESMVRRLGVLLAQLLGGSVPAASDRTAHEAMTRRVLIRAMSRSGPIFTERYRDWVSGMLAWDADQRPPLSGVAGGLREVAEGVGGRSLADWASEQVLMRARVAHEIGEAEDATRYSGASFHPWNIRDVDRDVPLLGDSDASMPSELIGSRTLPGIPINMLAGGDPTAETTLLPSGRTAAGTPTAEPGTMPIGVGPPAEAVQGRGPKLPAGFLDDDLARPHLEKRPAGVQILVLAMLGAVMAALVLVVLLVVVLQ